MMQIILYVLFYICLLVQSCAASKACKNVVNVSNDAFFCSSKKYCHGNGAKPKGQECPLAGAVAVANCQPEYPSYQGPGRCMAPVDSICEKSKNGAWQCVWTATNLPKSPIGPGVTSPGHTVTVPKETPIANQPNQAVDDNETTETTEELEASSNESMLPAVNDTLNNSQDMDIPATVLPSMGTILPPNEGAETRNTNNDKNDHSPLANANSTIADENPIEKIVNESSTATLAAIILPIGIIAGLVVIKTYNAYVKPPEIDTPNAFRDDISEVDL